VESGFDLQSATSAMVTDGRSAADKITKLRADTTLPRDHRFDAAVKLQDTTKTLIAKYHEGAQAAAGRLEGALVNGLLPRPVADSGQRMLARDEIRTLIGNRSGTAMVGAVMGHLGKNPSHDAELLSGFGESLFAGHGASDSFGAVKAKAVQTWLARADGTERQQANRKALKAFGASNVAARVVAYRQAGLMLLGQHDR